MIVTKELAKAVIQHWVHYDEDYNDYECRYCDAQTSTKIIDIKHLKNCPVLLAKKVLKGE